MALFSRKNPLDGEETVRLSSADHSWWVGEALDDVDAPADELDRTEGDDDVSSRIAAALQEYGYGGAGEGLDRAALTGTPAGHDDVERDGATGGDGGRIDEAALFARDGLPAEDRLAELLGTLGLEAHAEWVDIARAHSRLVAGKTTASFGDDDECRRRSANEAYACLRLFHH